MCSSPQLHCFRVLDLTVGGDYSESEVDDNDWVIVSIGDAEACFDVTVLDALLVAELAADVALRAAGAGFIDGNVERD